MIMITQQMFETNNQNKAETNQKNNPYITLGNKIDRLSRKSHKTFTNLDNLLDKTINAVQQAQMELQQPQADSLTVLNNLHDKMKTIKPLSNLHNQFNKLYKGATGIYKYVQQIQPPMNLQLFKIQPLFEKQQLDIIQQGIGDYYLRQNKKQIAQIFMASSAEQKSKLYQQCQHLKAQIMRGNLDTAIQWIDQKKTLGKQKSLSYQLKKIKIISLAKNNKGQQAINLLRSSMPAFADIRSEQISSLMSYVLAYSHQFWSDQTQLTKMLQKRYFHFEKIDLQQLAKDFEQIFFENNGLYLQNPIMKCYQTGRKYQSEIIDQIMKLPKTKEIPKVLPISINMDEQDRYHSQFFCPINKQLYTSEEKCVILKCGHMLSYAALGKINQSRNTRRRMKCPICQKQHQPDEYTQVQF